jgi:hypothetical protein
MSRLAHRSRGETLLVRELRKEEGGQEVNSATEEVRSPGEQGRR